MQLNGKNYELSSPTVLSEFLAQEGYIASQIAVEVNLEIIPKSEYDKFTLKNSDTVEIVKFMGGGR